MTPGPDLSQQRREAEDILGTALPDVLVSTGPQARTLGNQVEIPYAGATPSPVEQSVLAHEFAHALHTQGDRAGSSPAAESSVDELEAAAEAAGAAALFRRLGLDWAERFVSAEARRRLSTRPRLLHCVGCSTDRAPSPADPPIPDPGTAASFQDWLSAFPPPHSAGVRTITTLAPAELQTLVAGPLGIPPDCADVGLILRHYYLKAHHQSLTVKAGPGKGVPVTIGAGISDKALGKVLVDLGSINFQDDRKGFRMAEFYKVKGSRLVNLKALLTAGLKPGDVLVWKRRADVQGNFQGHVQTVRAIDPAAGTITVIQGNMSQGVGVGRLEQKQQSFVELTGQPDGDADIKPAPEETVFGAGPWAL